MIDQSSNSTAINYYRLIFIYMDNMDNGHYKKNQPETIRVYFYNSD